MRRLAALVLVVFVVTLAGRVGVAQMPTKVHRIGFLGTKESLEQLNEAFAAIGHVNGRDIAIDARWPENSRLDQLPALAAELVRLKVDVIVAGGGTAARAAKDATAEIPIVFAAIIDPVSDGLVRNSVKPGGNVTGFTVFDADQAREQLTLLKDIIPDLKRVAILGDTGAALAPFKSNEDAALDLGLRTVVVKVERGATDFDSAFDTAKKADAQAVVVLSTPVTSPNRRQIAASALKYNIPTLSPLAHADAGGLISYGTEFSQGVRRAAVYVDKILKGVPPGELPVETIRLPELVINLKTARLLGLSVPPSVLSRATRVIDQ